jgi:hypothetical protein
MKTKFGSLGKRPSAMTSSFPRMLPVFPVTVVALILTTSAPELWARNHQTDESF